MYLTINDKTTKAAESNGAIAANAETNKYFAAIN